MTRSTKDTLFGGNLYLVSATKDQKCAALEKPGRKGLPRGQNTRSELGVALADNAYRDVDALIEVLPGESMGTDHVTEFVLRVTLGGRRDAFIQLLPHGFLLFVMHKGFLSQGHRV